MSRFERWVDELLDDLSDNDFAHLFNDTSRWD